MRRSDISVVAAMGVEAWAVRRRAPGLRLMRGGIGLRGWQDDVATAVVVSVGLAGGLRADLAPGTVVIATDVALEDGAKLECDKDWVESLTAAAARLRLPFVAEPVLTALHLVTGGERSRWSEQGFAAVDMESAHLGTRAPTLAVVRVVLDTPNHELSPAWERPGRAALDPRNARELVWLLRNVPRYALRAASVLAETVRRDIDAKV